MVAQVFKEPAIQWNGKNVSIGVPATEHFIPANLLGQNAVDGALLLGCQHTTQQLTIHPDAFRASRTCISFLEVDRCNLAGFNFSFLNAFSNLKILRFSLCANIDAADWKSLPSLLPALVALQIKFIKLDKWIHFPILHNGLKYVDLSGNFIGDAAMDRILQWLIDSPSVDTLETLDLSETFLTEIPKKFSLFKNLCILYMNSNLIKTIPSGSITALNVPADEPVAKIHLHSCDIDTIEPGAFQGIVDLKEQ